MNTYEEKIENILNEGSIWEDPVLFDVTVGETIPADLLPSPFAEFAKAVAEATETPESMVTLTVLGVLSLILCRKFCVEIKEGYSEPLNLYIFIAMESGNRKSGVFKLALSPILAWEKQKRKELEPEIAKATSARLTMQAIIDKKRKKASTQADIDEIAALEKKLPTIPISPQLFVTDATPESLRNKVIQQNGYTGALTDEGGIIDVIAGLYNGGKANIDLILKGIEGGLVRVVRMNEDVSLQPYLTFVLVVQPSILSMMAEQKSFTGRGLLERFLYCIPPSPLGYRKHDTLPISKKVKSAYENAITTLLNIPDNLQDGEVVQQLLRPNVDAFEHWRQFQLLIEDKMRPSAPLSICKGWASKLPGFVFRIAANLYVSKHHKNIKNMGKIDMEAIESAIDIGNKLTEHGKIAFKSMVCDHKTQQARALWQWILAQKVKTIARAAITYGVKNRASGKAETLDVLLNELMDRHLLRERYEKTTGRPVTFYDLNPKTLPPDM